MRLDLHLHTTCSDGIFTPEEVVSRAVAGGLDAIAVTDHDTTQGVAPAQRAARGRIRVVPAVEMSTRRQGESIHILGYCVDPDARALTDHCRSLHLRRQERMEEIVGRLAAQGIDLPLSRVNGQRASGTVPYTRPHLARALVRAGYATSVGDAFARYIGADCPAYVLVESPTPEEAIDTILVAGGLPVWAHPPLRLIDANLPMMIGAGLRGLEAYRPWPRRVRDAVASRARAAGLFVTGGSDWHGRDTDGALGDFWVGASDVAAFLAAGGVRAPERPRNPPNSPSATAESLRSRGSRSRGVLTSESI